MTFSRIKPVGWQVNEKLTSPQMTQLDIDHANAVDKTGETAGLGGGVTGEIEWLSGSSIVIDTGAIINMNGGTFDSNIVFNSALTTPTLLQASPASDLAVGALNFQGADAFSSASIHQNGGNVIISTGNATGIGAFGNLVLQTGHGAYANPVFSTDASGNTYINPSKSSSLNGIEITNGLNQIIMGCPVLEFASAVSTPSIIQASTTGAATSLTIQAQGTTSSTFGQNGGSLILAAGTTAHTQPGNIIIKTTTDVDAVGVINFEQNGTSYAFLSGDGLTLYPTPAIGAGFGGQSLSVSPWVGTVNTQQRSFSSIKYVMHTTASGSNPYVDTYDIPNGAGGYLKVRWTAKTTAGASGPIMGEAIMCFQSDGSGSITESVSWINTATPSGTFKDTNSYILYPTTTGSFTTQLIAQTVALDWTIIAEFVLN